MKDVLTKLHKRSEGILLMRDIQEPLTAKAMPAPLDALKASGYKIVHVKAVPNALKRTDAALRARAATLPPFCHPLHSGD